MLTVTHSISLSLSRNKNRSFVETHLRFLSTQNLLLPFLQKHPHFLLLTFPFLSLSLWVISKNGVEYRHDGQCLLCRQEPDSDLDQQQAPPQSLTHWGGISLCTPFSCVLLNSQHLIMYLGIDFTSIWRQL